MDQQSTELSQVKQFSWAAFLRPFRMFWEPQKVFAELRHNPTFLWVLLLAMAVGLAANWVVTAHLDMAATVRAQLERTGRSLSDEQMERAIEGAQRWAQSPLAKITAPMGALVTLLLLGGVYFLGLKVVGSDAEYPQVLATVVHANFPPQLVQSTLLAVVAAQREKFTAQEIPRLVKSNLGAFLPENVGQLGQTLAEAVDLFNFWLWILLVLGLSQLPGVQQSQAVRLVAVLWGLWVLAKALLVSLL